VTNPAVLATTVPEVVYVIAAQLIQPCPFTTIDDGK